MPWEESRRMDKRSADENGSDEGKNEWSAPLSAQSNKKSAKEGNKRTVQEVYDHEVYDDRMFYAMLLKVMPCHFHTIYCVFNPNQMNDMCYYTY